MCSTWLRTLKIGNIGWKLHGFCSIQVGSADTLQCCSAWRTATESGSVNFQRQAYAFLAFCFFFLADAEGVEKKRERERDGVFYTGRYLKILFFPLEIAATWCCSRSGKEAAAVRTAPLHKRRTHCCRPAAWRHSKAWTRVKGLPKRLTSEYLPGPSNCLLVYSLPKRNNGPYLLGRQDTPSGTGIIYTYLVCPECSCM